MLDRVQRSDALRLYAEGPRTPNRAASSSPTRSSSSASPVEDGDGRPVEDRIILIDEVLTPDSSRFWPQGRLQPGRRADELDKQFVRDYLERIRWNKQPPVPSLPDDVVAKTREKYVEAFQRLTGRELDGS